MIKTTDLTGESGAKIEIVVKKKMREQKETENNLSAFLQP